MEVRQFDYDPLSGTNEKYFYDHATDQFTLTREQEITPLIELNKAKQINAAGRYGNEMLHQVASIPFALLPELEKQGIMTAGGRILDEKALRRWLNDSDNRVFRTRLGRV